MSKVIIYPHPDHGIVVIYPTGAIPLDEVGRKDVPAGVPYRIVEPTDLPPDWAFQAAWEADFSTPDGIGADYGAGSTILVIGYDAEGKPILHDPDNPTPQEAA